MRVQTQQTPPARQSQQLPRQGQLTRHRATGRPEDGPAGNERLTAWAGAVLLVLLAVEGVTVLSVRQLLVPHVVVGLLLIGPIVLKLASTGYRFTRYYTKNPEYRRAGPPQPLLRVLAPFLVIATVLLLGSGTLLVVTGPTQSGIVLGVHKASFLLWFMLTSVHVLAYVWRVPRLLSADVLRRSGSALRHGVAFRLTAVGAALALGIAIAGLLVGRAQPWVDLARLQHDH